MNAHSPSWNLYYIRQQNIRSLKDLINQYKLIIDNNTDFSTCLQSQRTFIINLALTKAKLKQFTLWEILEKYLLISNHKLILL